MAISTIQNIEIIWTAGALVGIFLALYNFRSANKAVNHLNSLIDHRVEIMKSARASRIEEFSRFLIQTIEAMIGIIAMTLPATDTSFFSTKAQIAYHMIQWGLIATSWLTLFQSFNSFWLRRFFLVGKMEN